MSSSKSLGHGDESGFAFVKEILAGDVTAAINFDRIQKHPKEGYIIFEFLLCEETQKTVTPYTSHPKYYWSKNSRKFISLWQVAQDLKAKLFLANYAKSGTPHQDEVLLIEVLELNEKGIQKEITKKMTRKSFSDFFRQLNRECLQ